MKIKDYKKIIYLITMTLLLLGILMACSNSADEPNDLSENQNEAEHQSIDIDGGGLNDPLHENVGDHHEDLPNEGESNENRTELDNEVSLDDEAAEGSDAHNANEGSLEVDTDLEENEEVPSRPAEPAESEKPSDDNSRDERPTLRSPVNSNDDPRALTIGVLNLVNERAQTSFRESYTKGFEWDHPNIDIEFSIVTEEHINYFRPPTTDTAAEFKKLLTGDNPPDVLFLNYSDYSALMEEGLLVALDPFLVESELSLDDFVPVVADGLVNPQDGQTYGLTPYFTASAVVYNKDLFDEMNTPYPQDHMTWEEIFTLAKQMTFHDGEKNIYGFMFDMGNYRPPMIDELWRRYIPGLDVQVYDLETEKMDVNNDKWAYILSSMKDLYDAGVFPLDSSEGEGLARNKFFSGTIAMGVVDYRDLYLYPSTLRWDIVSMPVHPEAPHVGAGTILEPVIAINANGRNQLDAWRLIEWIHSSETASGDEYSLYRLSSRKDNALRLQEQNYNKEAFYQLRPAKEHEPFHFQFGHHSIHNKYIGMLKLNKVFSGEFEIQEALDEWEFWGNNTTFE